MRLLLISNGNGEDRIAVELARAWKQERPHDQIRALALVGSGQFYQDAQIDLLPPRFLPPSQGFAYLHPGLLWQDIRAGLCKHLGHSLKIIKQERAEIDFVLAVGDIVALIAARHSLSPGAFVACALSDYYCFNEAKPTETRSSFDPMQIHLLKRLQYPTFARDALTAQNLIKKGIKAYALGNPMLDAFTRNQDSDLATELSSKPIYDPNKTPQIGLLPGSHQDALQNLELILQQLAPIENRPLELHLVLAPQIKPVKTQALLHAHNWQIRPDKTHNQYWKKSDLTLQIVDNAAFKETLQELDFVIGLSGTANEQAVAYGVPVISFASTGQQYNWHFGEAQQRLLGAGLSFLGDPHPDLISWQVKQHIKYLPGYRAATRQVARERFGLPGASARIVKQIQSQLGI